jgi:2-polyprenyl-6-methoxyphenol hydroxylase-like FAD-dependent oxidoreductase
VTRSREIVVLGGGVAGLAAALALGRDGHRVTVVDRDDLGVGEPLDALEWDRRGIPHFHQPHAFTPRGRKELLTTFPDVYEALLAAGAWDLDLRPRIRGRETRPDDAELAFVAARRPLIEWALRRAAAAQSNIVLRGGVRATGLEASSGNGTGEAGPHVHGARTTDGTMAADLVVDAMGRRTPTPDWIQAIGGRPMPRRSEECSIIYYCRYYRIRDGRTLPEGPWLPGPRGDLGYGAFSTFPGDNRTFAALLAFPPADRALKTARHVPAFEAAIAAIPALDSWTNEETSEPITAVLPMGSLQNTIRAFADGRAPAAGFVGVGDAVIHTDPVLAMGLAFALIHARLLAQAVREADADPATVPYAFEALARPEMEERYAYVTAIDDTRTRLWAGESIDITHADGGAYPFFTYAAAGVASLAEGELARALVRRNQFLDPLSVLDYDATLLAELEAFWERLRAPGRPRPGPDRQALIGLMRAAVAEAPTPVGAGTAG